MKKYGIQLLSACILIFACILSYGCKDGGAIKNEAPVLRVGWMTSWATAGQVVESLINTEITKNNGVKVEFKSFPFGPPMNEAALAGSLDATIVGDMPAISLLAASDKWSVVARSVSFPYGLAVRPGVIADKIEHLKGKTIGVPFGSGPQPTLYKWIEEAGLEIGKSITVVNLTPQEMAEALKAKRVDAIMTWEPTMTVLEKEYGARVIKEAVGVGFICMTNEFIKNHPKEVKAFVKSWKEGIYYYKQNEGQTDAWFAADSKMPVELLGKLRKVDKNLSAKQIEEVDVKVSEEDIKKNQSKADFAFKQGLIKRQLVLGKLVYQ